MSMGGKATAKTAKDGPTTRMVQQRGPSEIPSRSEFLTDFCKEGEAVTMQRDRCRCNDTQNSLLLKHPALYFLASTIHLLMLEESAR